MGIRREIATDTASRILGRWGYPSSTTLLHFDGGLMMDRARGGVAEEQALLVGAAQPGAHKMLADPRRSVTEVDMACGFAAAKHLATLFRKQPGVKLGEHRREQLA